MRQLSCNFLNSISLDISEAICCYKYDSVNVSDIKRCTIPDFSSLNGSKSSTSSIGNTPIILSKYPILDNHNIDTSNLEERPLDVIYFKNFFQKLLLCSKRMISM